MAKFAVSFKYLVKPSNYWETSSNLGRKNFTSKKDAEVWVDSQVKMGKIQPLKLFDCSDINCPELVREYKTKPVTTGTKKVTHTYRPPYKTVYQNDVKMGTRKPWI